MKIYKDFTDFFNFISKKLDYYIITNINNMLNPLKIKRSIFMNGVTRS